MGFIWWYAPTESESDDTMASKVARDPEAICDFCDTGVEYEHW